MEEFVKDMREVFALSQIDLKNGTYLGLQVVLAVLGFPVAAREVEAIAQGAIGPLTIGQCLFGDEHPVRGLGKGRQQVLKGAPYCRFVSDLLLGVRGKFLVVVVDGSLLDRRQLHLILIPSLSIRRLYAHKYARIIS